MVLFLCLFTCFPWFQFVLLFVFTKLIVSNVLSTLLPQRAPESTSEVEDSADIDGEDDEEEVEHTPQPSVLKAPVATEKETRGSPMINSFSEDDMDLSIFTPSPASIKKAIRTSCTPILYWTLAQGEYWIVAVAESKFVQFGIEVVGDGVVVHWVATPPPTLAITLDLPSTTTEIQKIEGTTKISAPQPILEDTSLVSKIPHHDFRILKCKFKNKVKVMF